MCYKYDKMKNKTLIFLLITAIIVFGFVIRLFPHMHNFAPMGALALFAAAFYKRKYLAFIAPATVWFLSDLYLNNFVYQLSEGFTFFSSFQLYNVIAIALIVILGTFLFKKLSVAKIALGSVSASLIFFIVSNFGVWLQGGLYPKTFAGLTNCFTMAIPFYKATFVSDMIFTIIFFGAMYFITKSNTVKTTQFDLLDAK